MLVQTLCIIALKKSWYSHFTQGTLGLVNGHKPYLKGWVSELNMLAIIASGFFFFFFLWSTWFHVQLMGFGFENLMWFIHCCQEPPREIPPMTKVMRREPDRQRQIRPQGTPWICSSIYPKTRICLSYYFVPFTNSSVINRGLSPTTFLWKKST